MRSDLVQILRSDDSDLGPSTDPVVRRFWGAVPEPGPRRGKDLCATAAAPKAEVIDLARWVAARARA